MVLLSLLKSYEYSMYFLISCVTPLSHSLSQHDRLIDTPRCPRADGIYSSNSGLLLVARLSFPRKTNDTPYL